MSTNRHNHNQANQDQIRDYLSRPDVRPAVIQLVCVWNANKLLGIDLADELRSLVGRANAPLDLDSTDWGELAEELAEEICAVTEDELTMRREEAADRS